MTNLEIKKLILYTDGGARGNPGPAGAGAVIYDQAGKILKQDKKFLGVMTNNEAEYHALIFGLELVKKLVGKSRVKDLRLEARMDSELVVKQLNGQYQIKEADLQPLFLKVWNARVADFHHLTFAHIPRAKNDLADQLANEAMDISQSAVYNKA